MHGDDGGNGQAKHDETRQKYMKILMVPDAFKKALRINCDVKIKTTITMDDDGSDDYDDKVHHEEAIVVTDKQNDDDDGYKLLL